jgi:hypothetical protein
VYAAKQRLGVDPDIETSFSIEGAIDVYRNIQRKGREDWDALGYATREQYVTATHRLWSEIQEVSLNAADYYLTRAVEQPHRAAEHSRSASRIYARYLAFFHRFARADAREAVPDSAYFAAYEAARGFGDALTRYTPGRVSSKEMDLATRRYVSGLRLFPFDRGLWSSLTAALERQGRESDYLDLVRPVAEGVTRSRHVNSWIESQEPGAERIAVLRRAFADSQALVYLGFADDSDVADLEASIGEIRVQRDAVDERLVALSQRREAYGRSVPAAPDPNALPETQLGGLAELELSEVTREIEDSGRPDRAPRQAGRRTQTGAAPLQGHARGGRPGRRAARATRPSGPHAVAAHVPRDELLEHEGREDDACGPGDPDAQRPDGRRSLAPCSRRAASWMVGCPTTWSWHPRPRRRSRALPWAVRPSPSASSSCGEPTKTSSTSTPRSRA